LDQPEGVPYFLLIENSMKLAILTSIFASAAAFAPTSGMFFNVFKQLMK